MAFTAGEIFALGLLGYAATRKKGPGVAPSQGAPVKTSIPIPQGKLPNTVPSKKRFPPLLRGIQVYLDPLKDQLALSQATSLYDTSGRINGVGSYLQAGFLGSAQATDVNKPTPGATDEVEALQRSGNLIVIETWHQMGLYARMIAGAAAVANQPGAAGQAAAKITNEFSNFLKTSRKTLTFSDAFKSELTGQMAQRIHEIGGIQTDRWLPANHGVFREGVNGYTVPQAPAANIQARLLQYDAIDFLFELAAAEALDAGMKQLRGDTSGVSRIVAGVAKLAAEVAAQTVEGLKSGGPWGALIGAIKGAVESALKQAFAGVSQALEKVKKENDLMARVDRALVSMASLVGGVRYPIQDMHYGMSMPGESIPADQRGEKEVKAPFSSHFQRAMQNNTAGNIFSFGAAPAWIAQGVYPGVGLHAYKPYFGGVRYAFTSDGDDDMSPEMWARAPGFPGSGKVSP